MSKERIISNKEKSEDKALDLTLRPAILNDFVGQQKIKENIKIFMTAAKQRGEAMEHVLFHGPPGLGKTTLAHILAKEIRVNIRVTSGPAIERAGDLAAILTNLEDGDILFIDEIHRLNRLIEEVLYPAMEDYALDIVIGKGPAARTLRLDLPKFTLVGATTRYHLLSSPLRDRFGSTFRLDYYSQEDIQKIIDRSARILSIDLQDDSSKMIAQRARLTPRIANRLLKRVRDYVQVKGDGILNPQITQKALELMEVDIMGLDSLDRKILSSIIEKFKGGPVGLNSIAALVQEEEGTIEEIYEPYLIQLGFLARTPRGRVVTENAYKHLGLEVPGELQSKLI
ncbi:Holliday junction branch migration DNA helicase RuvB [Patescibacteria group bacterium]|nr:Holliday junction branch migration DNA helicase RuvB [Patescibacteria group bacterium]